MSAARWIANTSASFGESILPSGIDNSIGANEPGPRSITTPAPAIVLPIEASTNTLIGILAIFR